MSLHSTDEITWPEMVPGAGCGCWPSRHVQCAFEVRGFRRLRSEARSQQAACMWSDRAGRILSENVAAAQEAGHGRVARKSMKRRKEE